MQAKPIDMDGPRTAGLRDGFDFDTGFGLVQADAALTRVRIRFSPAGSRA